MILISVTDPFRFDLDPDPILNTKKFHPFFQCFFFKNEILQMMSYLFISLLFVCLK